MAEPELKPIVVPAGVPQPPLVMPSLDGLHSILAHAYHLHTRGELHDANIQLLGSMLDHREATTHLAQLDALDAACRGALAQRCIVSHIQRQFLRAVKLPGGSAG